MIEEFEDLRCRLLSVEVNRNRISELIRQPDNYLFSVHWMDKDGHSAGSEITADTRHPSLGSVIRQVNQIEANNDIILKYIALPGEGKMLVWYVDRKNEVHYGRYVGDIYGQRDECSDRNAATG